MRKPNILLITADQLRQDALGCYANTVCRTPNLDALAAGGVVFENAFTPNPICVPARACITTGNYPHVCTGIKSNSGRIRDDQVKLAEHFNAAGYRSYACGKLHYTPYSPPDQPRLVHGFGSWDSCESGRMLAKFDPRNERGGVEDYIDYLGRVGWAGHSRSHGIGNNDVRPCASPLPQEHHVDHWVADRTIERMREHLQNQADSPFLIWCSFPKPHSPYDPPFEYSQLYDPREVPAPFGDESMLSDRNPVIQHIRVTHAQATLSPEARRVIKAYYYGLITFQDAQVGRVIAAMQKLGVLDNTIIIYTADHGDLMGDFGAYFKCNFLNGSVRVPLIVRAPGVPANQRRSQLAGLQDILPTLAGMTGCGLPRQVQGLDLRAAMTGESAPLRDVFYSQCGEHGHQTAMVTDGRWKYCYAERGGVDELYDLQQDPNELVNLASRAGHEDALTHWRGRLVDEALRLGDDTMVADGKLPVALLDRAAIDKLGVGGMGWRWY